MVNQTRLNRKQGYFLVKRLLDLILALVGLAVLLIPFLIIAALIKMEDHGKVFFAQTRVGKNGQPFKMYKFRSMVVNADEIKAELMAQNEIEGAMFKMKHDPRITKTGRFIRKYSLDELPQLLNVIKGEMALVGPRPPLPSEVAEYTDYDRQRLLVTPGCTGLWQATVRNDSTFDEMVALDLQYINRCSLWFDLKIIIMTVKVIIVPNSAY
ncbi:MAG: sugar transferase [Limosilactobacillus sp.]|nr:sugar transferase [Limosilactobacillus sp.]